MNRFHLLLLTAVLMFAMNGKALGTDAPYYTWVDDNGVVNYSQEKPRGIDAKLVSRKHRFGENFGTRRNSAPKPVTGQTAAPSISGPVADINRDAEKTIQEIEAEVQAQRAQACQRALDNMQRYSSRGRIRVRGADGEYRIATDEEKQRTIDDIQAQIDENC